MANTNSNGASLKNILKVPEIQKRLLFTFLILVVVRFGAQIPIPGVSRDVFASWFANQSNGAMDLFDMMTGGSFSQMSVFALSITPYITSINHYAADDHHYSFSRRDAEGSGWT